MSSRIASCLLLALFAGCKADSTPKPAVAELQVVPPPPVISSVERAEALAKRFIIIDGHIDLPYRLHGGRDAAGKITEDPSVRTAKGDFDYPRAIAGGLDAPFMSIYVPAQHQTSGGAMKLADQLIDMVEGLAAASKGKMVVARSTAQVEALHGSGKVALLLGIENGAAVEKRVENVKHFFDRGVRYITLTHSKDNLICDSSYDTKKANKGLSTFGKEVVGAMNSLGIMVDVSHISDDAFWQVIELSTVPVIASHSSCRHFTPGFERNMSDDMIRALAKNGGVVMINFGSGFISEASRNFGEVRRKAAKHLLEDKKLPWSDPKVKAFFEKWDAEHPPTLATVEDVADHIDHVVKLVGADHVGFGSDFDGVGPSLPVGLEDVSKYPNLIRVLVERGYSDDDIEKICGKNLLRVWRAVEAKAAAR